MKPTHTNAHLSNFKSIISETTTFLDTHIKRLESIQKGITNQNHLRKLEKNFEITSEIKLTLSTWQKEYGRPSNRSLALFENRIRTGETNSPTSGC